MLELQLNVSKCLTFLSTFCKQEFQTCWHPVWAPSDSMAGSNTTYQQVFRNNNIGSQLLKPESPSQGLHKFHDPTVFNSKRYQQH